MLDRGFISMIGETCTFSVLSSSADSSLNPFFHKGPVYLPHMDELYVNSDLLQSTSSSELPIILISKFSFRRRDPSLASPETATPIASLEWMKLRPPPNMPMPSGAIPYKEGILYCSQGNFEPRSGGLFYMPLGKRPIPLVTSYFGKPFNSIQDVVEDSDGALWFTDSSAGQEHDIRPAPQLPSHVYWFRPETGQLCVVADGLRRPTGIALSRTGSTIYISDTDAARVGNTAASTSFVIPYSPATIYAYDIVRRQNGPPSLEKKRIFSFAFSGVPAAIVCDSSANVFAACADGVEVWNSRGVALGVIQVPGGCSSLCFGQDGELFVCGGQTLWRVNLRTYGPSDVEEH
ncbi:hypothetical protein GGR50DRAFT_675627 [Xylaria sp. CBS 124048]|nr:hypothetical protein GGR50DRAFT_675627 [Xylaria sp. CBS 124048]